MKGTAGVVAGVIRRGMDYESGEGGIALQMTASAGEDQVPQSLEMAMPLMTVLVIASEHVRRCLDDGRQDWKTAAGFDFRAG